MIVYVLDKIVAFAHVRLSTCLPDALFFASVPLGNDCSSEAKSITHNGPALE